MSGGKGSRAAAVVGGTLAALLCLGLVAGLGYAFTNFEDLQQRATALKAGVDQETVATSELDQAADNAIGYADEVAASSPPDDGSGPGYTFSHPAPVGADIPAAHWCGGRTIGYRIDFTGAEAAGSTREKEIDRWEQAFAVWSQASGGRYTFSYRGPADYPVVRTGAGRYPVDPATVPSGEIAITYAVPMTESGARWDGYRHPDLAEALGIGGVGPVDWAPGPQQGVISQGTILLDALDSELDPRAMPVPYRHEIGHALGLGHVTDPAQLMYHTADSDSQIGPGDRSGIRRLAALPCG